MALAHRKTDEIAWPRSLDGPRNAWHQSVPVISKRACFRQRVMCQSP